MSPVEITRGGPGRGRLSTYPVGEGTTDKRILPPQVRSVTRKGSAAIIELDPTKFNKEGTTLLFEGSGAIELGSSGIPASVAVWSRGGQRASILIQEEPEREGPKRKARGPRWTRIITFDND